VFILYSRNVQDMLKSCLLGIKNETKKLLGIYFCHPSLFLARPINLPKYIYVRYLGSGFIRNLSTGWGKKFQIDQHLRFNPLQRDRTRKYWTFSIRYLSCGWYLYIVTDLQSQMFLSKKASVARNLGWNSGALCTDVLPDVSTLDTNRVLRQMCQQWTIK
jgi:hypothetical protein